MAPCRKLLPADFALVLAAFLIGCSFIKSCTICIPVSTPVLSSHFPTFLRSSAPKKRPMIFRQKIKSADFYFSSRGSQILFQNVFILIQFCFFPKMSTHDVAVWSDGTQITFKISPFEIPSELIIATQNNKTNYTGIKKRAF